jgi:hypothetical protein
MYLFVTYPNNCGSTLMARLLATSPNVSCLRGRPTLEGHDVCREYMPHPGKLPNQPVRAFTEERFYFRDESEYDWDGIKKCWHEAWDMNKPIQLEKSPPNVVKAEQLAEHMQPSKFVIGMRDVYAYVQSMKAYHGYAPDDALHWGRCAAAQLRNLERIGNDRVLLLNYEDLCDHPEKSCEQLIDFVPELESLDWESLDVQNANKGDQLEKWDREEIQRVLSGNERIVREMGYRL